MSFLQLCYLHADLFKNLGAKETKKQFVEFHNTFIDKSAVSVFVDRFEYGKEMEILIATQIQFAAKSFFFFKYIICVLQYVNKS